MRFELRKHKELESVLTRLIDETTGQILSDITESGARTVESKAKQIVPVDTGYLRSTINSTPGEISKTRAEWLVQPDTEYQHFVEYGTINQSAQPYMRPAFDENVDRIISVIQKTFQMILDKVW